MQSVQASTQSTTPYFSSSTSSPSYGKVFKVAVLGFLATLGGASAQRTFQIGNHTTGLRRASCIEMNNGDLNCVWTKDGNLYREVVSPIFEDVLPQVAIETGGDNSINNLYKLNNGQYFNLWSKGSLAAGKYQRYSSTHSENQAVGSFPSSTVGQIKANAAVLQNGQPVVAWIEGSNGKQIILDANTLASSSVSTISSVEVSNGIIPKNSNWTVVFDTDINLKAIDFSNDFANRGATTLFTNTGTSKIRIPKGHRLPNDTNLVAWAKISETNQTEGYYYKRFEDDRSLIDTTEQILLEGNLGSWDSENDILSVASGDNDSTWVTFIANDDVLTQELSSTGIMVGVPQSIGTTGALEVSSFNITDGPGITWRNASGLFGTIWNRVFPTPTPTPSPTPTPTPSLYRASAPFTTELSSPNNTSVESSQVQTTHSGRSTIPSSYATVDSNTAATTEEVLNSTRLTAPTPSSPMASSSGVATTMGIGVSSPSSTEQAPINSSLQQDSSQPRSAETLSTASYSSEESSNSASSSTSFSLSPSIDGEIIPLSISPLVSSWEVIDGTLHVSFTETIDIEDQDEITLFTFATGEGGWDNLILEADAGSCIALNSRIENNGDGTSSYNVLFDNDRCSVSSGDQVQVSWLSAFVGFFSGIYGRLKNWV